MAVLADRALAAEEDVEESKPGVAEIKVEETTKLVGLLEDLSRRIKKLETVTTSERKINKGRGRVNNNYAPAPTFAPNVQASGFVNNQPSHYRNEQNIAPPFVPPPNAQATEFVNKSNNCTNAQQNDDLSHRRRKRHKIMSRNRPTQPLHRFATTTKLTVKRRACAVNPVRTMSH